MKFCEPLGVMAFGRNSNSKTRKENPLILEWNSSADSLCAFREKPDLSGKACLVEIGAWRRDMGTILWWKWSSLFLIWSLEFPSVPALALCAALCLYSSIRQKSSQCAKNELSFSATESGQQGWWPSLSLRNLSLPFCHSHSSVCPASLLGGCWQLAPSSSCCQNTSGQPCPTWASSLARRESALKVSALFPLCLHFKKSMLIPQGHTVDTGRE